MIAGSRLRRVPWQDAERARSFYGETLGLRPDDNAQIRILGRRHCLGIWEPEEAGRQFQPQKNGHIAFHVEDVAGGPCGAGGEGSGVHGEAFDTGVCHMALFTDPDGNDLMLHHRYAPVE